MREKTLLDFHINGGRMDGCMGMKNIRTYSIGSLKELMMKDSNINYT